MFKISKDFGFEMAHMLAGHDGQCLNLHGHSYKLTVVLKSENCGKGSEYTDNGVSGGDMILDFSRLKQIVKETVTDKLDHAFAYYINSADTAEKEIAAVLIKNGRKVYGFPFRPTAEKMAENIFHLLQAPLMAEHCRLDKVILYETAESCAEYSD